MSSVGGVGGAGGGSFSGSVSGSASAGSSAVAPAASVGDGADSISGDVGSTVGNGDGPEKFGSGQQPSITINNNNNMSTQDHLEMRGCSAPSQAQESELDLKKLIEMIIAIKLLQELTKAMNNGS